MIYLTQYKINENFINYWSIYVSIFWFINQSSSKSILMIANDLIVEYMILQYRSIINRI